MSQHDGRPPSADWVAQEMEQMLRECNALLESHDEQLRRLRNAISDIEAERKLACDNRDEAQRILDALRSAALAGQQLHAEQAHFPNPHLRVAPDTDVASTVRTRPQATPAGPDGGASGTAAIPESNPVMFIGGERSVTIMKVISTDGQRHWSVRDVTEALGEPAEAVRRNRSVLENLRVRGAVTKTESPDNERPGKKKVFYQLAAPWQAA
ncbi:hypothetical protein ACJWDR_18860 [Streptomyces tauricus]|uniref:hypothetical protein n=1 Tax=Streptomyces tauricus TaxID=68274 RepID=UPI00387F10D9